MAIATFTVEIENVKLNVTAFIIVLEKNHLLSITKILLKKQNIKNLISDIVLEQIKKEIRKQIC